MHEFLKDLVKKALDMGAYDVHLKAAFPPVFRIGGRIQRINLPPVSPKELEKVVLEILDKEKISIFRNQGQTDFSLDLPDLCRVRMNVFLQRNSLAISIRLVPPKLHEPQELGFAMDTVDALKKINRGLILVTGATNSGKSTTVAAILNMIAKSSAIHAITIEDPIEYVFPRYENSVISQRQVGDDTPDFGTGLTSSLRQDPDVIVIGELRDQETVETSLKAAETGHLVFGTLHTSNAVQSLTRLINIFPSHQREGIRFMLSSSLKMIISQILIPCTDRKTRVLAYEVLPMLPSVTNLIRQKKIHEISSVIRIGRQAGCVPMSTTIAQLLKMGRISEKDIPKEFREKP